MIEQFQRRLLSLLNTTGITPRRLSIEIGHDPSYISKILNGPIFPTFRTFAKICSAFKIQPAEFWNPTYEDSSTLGRLYCIIRDWPEETLECLYKMVSQLEPKVPEPLKYRKQENH